MSDERIDDAHMSMEGLRTDITHMRDLASAAGTLGMSGMATQLSRIASSTEENARRLYRTWKSEFQARTAARGGAE